MFWPLGLGDLSRRAARGERPDAALAAAWRAPSEEPGRRCRALRVSLCRELYGRRRRGVGRRRLGERYIEARRRLLRFRGRSEGLLDAAVDAVGGELRRCVSVREHTERDSADDALAACCAASISIRNAPDFLDRVLEAAREADPARLLSLPLPAVEPFLRKRDPALLWRHHAGRGRHAAAAALMEDLATASGAGSTRCSRVGVSSGARARGTR